MPVLRRLAPVLALATLLAVCTGCEPRDEGTALLTNKTPSGTYRGPGRCEGSFFCERLIELAARDLGIGSAEMRRHN